MYRGGGFAVNAIMNATKTGPGVIPAALGTSHGKASNVASWNKHSINNQNAMVTQIIVGLALKAMAQTSRAIVGWTWRWR